MVVRAVIIGGSAGSFPVVQQLLSELPKTYKLPIIMVLHRLRNVQTGFAEALNYSANIQVIEPFDKQKIQAGCAYLAPSNYHLMVEQVGNRFALSTDELVKFSRPSIDVLFQTAAYAYREKMVGIILSGANKDGVNGIVEIKNKGGFTIAQTPESCAVSTMTQGAIDTGKIDKTLSPGDIVAFLKQLG